MTESKPIKILEVMRLLETQTDDEHALSVNDIIKALDEKGLSSERKSIYTYMDHLEAFGLDIITSKESANYYHIGNRLFQLPELKLLVDAVQFSKFITKEKSKELIEKLQSLTSVHEAQKLVRDDMMTDRLKAKNASIYLNVDAIHEAILSQKRLRFRYFEYDLQKNIVYRKNGETYTMIPEFLCWDDEKYYCVMYSESHEDHVIFRVDKMRDVVVLDSTHSKERKREDLEKYCTRLFSMFQGEEKRVKMRFQNDLVNVVLDRFGMDTDLLDQGDGHFIIEVNLIVSQTFLSWMVQFEDKAQIIGPQDVVDVAVSMLRKTLSQYEQS